MLPSNGQEKNMADSGGKCVSHLNTAQQSQEVLYHYTHKMNIRRFFACLRFYRDGHAID
jgi:hypothetical protein